MRKQLLCSVKKDFTEYIRTKKNIVFSLTLLFLCAMVFCSAKFLPNLIDILIENVSQVISDTESIKSTLLTFFPNALRANMGVLASDMVVIYGIVVILSTYNLTSKEIISGSWIFPLNVGYKPFILVFSKGIVYGLGAAFPCVVFYNLYYFIGNMYLTPDYGLPTAAVNSVVLGIAIFSVVYLTVMLSAVYKQSMMSSVTMILFVAVVPDVFSLFSFGAYLPTHMFTYLYQSKSDLIELLIPMIFLLALEVLFTVLAAKKSVNVEAAR